MFKYIKFLISTQCIKEGWGKKKRVEVRKELIECSWIERLEVEGWAGMGGLLFLACWAICPGVKMCTHRGCPWAKGGRHWQATSRCQWVRVSPRRWQPSLFGTPNPPPSLLPSPPYSSTHCLICHCQVSLHGAARVKLALWKRREDVCPAYGAFWS